MPKIDTSSWGEFVVGDLFTIDRGKRQKAQDRVKGDIPYYSASNEANGMTDIIGNPTFTDKDTIIGTTFGDFFYVNGVFSGSDEITIYHHPKVDGNEYIGLFVVSALKQNKHKYSFTSKMFKNRAEKDFIYLPIDSKGEPDWLYMENYMRNIEVRVSDSISKLESAQRVENSKIDVSNWGKFELRKLFGACRKGSRLVQAERIDGDVPLVTAGYENVGITSNIGNTNMEVFKDCISIDMFGNCFYRDYKFNADDNVLIFAENIKNKYVSMYIAGVVGKAVSGYDYTNQYRINNYNRQEIKLPTTSSGEPDWLYMENYMKSLETKVSDFLNKTA